MIREQFKTAVLIFLVLTIITGIIYPVFVTAIAQLLFKKQANGSIIFHDGKAVGSSLIGQQFDDPAYLWGRPSATSPEAYNSASSSGSNMGPSNAALLDAIKARVEKLRAADPGNMKPIPVDLVTSSASGLDPHISLAGAYYQVSRIAKKRNVPEKTVEKIINHNTEGRFLGLVGEPVVNVLKVNLDLDSLKK